MKMNLFHLFANNENLFELIDIFADTNEYPEGFPKKIKTRFNFVLDEVNIGTLKPNTWVEDSIIECFLILLKDHADIKNPLYVLAFPSIIVSPIMNNDISTNFLG